MAKPLDRGQGGKMKEKILSLLGTGSLLVGIVLVMCLPYAESFPLWNAREGAIIGIPLVILGGVIKGMVAEER